MYRASCARLLSLLLTPVLLLLAPAHAAAQLLVQDNIAPAALAQDLAGPGVVISNVTYAGTTQSSGRFQGGLSIIGFDEGVILSSGWATDTPGPNNSDGTSRTLGTGGDPDLTALSGFPTFDKTVLQFTLVPQGNTLTFQYVFASEEYNEYVHTEFNDVFAFFVNGVNCALVPGTTQPVTINTINGGNPFPVPPQNNVQFYRNNDPNNPGSTINTGADGLTTVLTCTASVVAGANNTIKLAIADASDSALDSYVFLRANSFVSSNVTLTPLTATNPVGTTHTVTATVLENTQPAPNKVVTFTVLTGPHSPMSGTGTTNTAGQATFTYLGVAEGTDTLQASYTDPQGDLQQSNIVEKIWVDLGASTLDLQPRTATNPVGTQHCVTATALNAAGNPAANVTINFTVTGSVNMPGTGTTNASGEVQFCYTGPAFPGLDDIHAYADNNNNGVQDPTEPFDTAEKIWVLPQSTEGCKITYGGHITANNGDFANFGGNAKAPDKGNNNYTDHGPAQEMHFKMPTVLVVLCNEDNTHGTIYAETTSGDMARIDVQDLGEPGRQDTYRILIDGVDGVYDSGEHTLAAGGNIQIHH